MTTVLCPGSFDPPTNGHVDVVRRITSFADKVVIAVVGNPQKTALFSPERRVELFREIVDEWPDTDTEIEVMTHSGLLVDLVEPHQIDFIVKGVRSSDDYLNEQRMAQMNRSIGDVETLLLPTSPPLTFIASSLVREIVRLGGDVDHLVPPPVQRALGETR